MLDSPIENALEGVKSFMGINAYTNMLNWTFTIIENHRNRQEKKEKQRMKGSSKAPLFVACLFAKVD